LVLRDAVEDEAAALAVPDDADRPRLQVDGRRRALLVGQERDSSLASRDERDGADEAVGGDDRGVEADAVRRPRRDYELLLELARRTREHPRVDRREVGREARAVDVPELLPERRVLGRRPSVLDLLLAQVVDLGLQPLGPGARVHEAAEPPVRVAERRRYALRSDLERPQRRRPAALEAVQRPAVRLLEVDG